MREPAAAHLLWVALSAGTLASLAANVAVGATDLVGRAVAGWPAIALLVAVKMLAGLLDHQEDQQDTSPAATEITPPRPRQSKKSRRGHA